MKKFLFILQFSPGDREVAKTLLKLLCDLEPSKSPYADLMLSASFHASHDPEMFRMAEQKFDRVYGHKCQNNVTGWPAGPNSQMSEVVSEVFVGHRDRGWDYEAAMLMEPDFVPLRKDWIKSLCDEWHEKDQAVLGAFMSSGMFWCFSEHINGNMLVSPQFIKETKFFRGTWQGSWDTTVAPIILPKSRSSRLIWNDYRINSVHNPLPVGVTLEQYLFTPKRYPGNHPLTGIDIYPAYFHGHKGTEAIEIVRKKLL